MELSATSKIQVAVIGAGHLGRIHAKLLAARNDCKLVAVCDPVPSSRGWIEENLKVPTVPDYMELANSVDAIVVATPTIYHHQVGAWALERGIHTLIEKPIANTVQQAKELGRLASTHGAILQVGHVERFNPVWESLQARIEPKTVRYVESRREGVYTGRSTDIGIVLDLMIHDLDLILSLIDSPLTNIRATGRCVLGQHEDLAIADLEFQNGARAHLRASRISSTAARVMEIQAQREWYELDFSKVSLTATRATETVESGELQADGLDPIERARVKDELFTRWLDRTQTSPPTSNAIQAEHSDFLESIRYGRQPRVSGTAAIRALEVACAITNQITNGNLRILRRAA
jgi:predicted dehydrogenase